MKALLGCESTAGGDAPQYAEGSRGLNNPGWQIGQACEDILLTSGREEEAYQRYAIEANVGTTHLATFRAITRKYPRKVPADILRDLVASQPCAEGKWFAAAKDTEAFDFAIELASRSPTGPRTLARATRDYQAEQPGFALAACLAALRWIARGHGYEITSLDVWNTYDALLQAAPGAGLAERQLKVRVRALVDAESPWPPGSPGHLDADY